MSIAVRQLSKCFHLYARPWHRFQEWMSLGRRRRHTPFWALRDINLEIPAGTATGIIGPNGAGKSTLLKIITGTLFPTEGEVEVTGRVAGLLELGTGFHPEFTGRQNIYLNGKMLGLDDAEIAERFPDIVRFSELGDFIDQPIRTYSSGMAMRLGFSIASCVDPDVLIIDEVLSVGDAYFSQKCVRRIREFREQGVTILFVSHDPSAVLTLCDHAVLLEQGQLLRTGAPEEILDYYNARTAQRSAVGATRILVARDGDSLALGTQRSGNFRALVTAVDFQNARGETTAIFTAGEDATLTVSVLFLDAIDSPTVGILFRNRLGIEVFGVNTLGLGHPTGSYEAGQMADFVFRLPLNLGPDDYSITVAAHLDSQHLATNFDWVDKAFRFRVVNSADFAFYGLAKLVPRVETVRRLPPPEERSDCLAAVFGQPPQRLDASEACDTFFVEGLEPERETGRTCRLLDGAGRFLFQPSSPRLGVTVLPQTGFGSAVPTGLPFSLSWIGGSSLSVPGPDGGLRFELPAQTGGVLQIFRLHAPCPAVPAGVPAPVRVAAIESIPEGAP